MLKRYIERDPLRLTEVPALERAKPSVAALIVSEQIAVDPEEEGLTARFTDQRKPRLLNSEMIKALPSALSYSDESQKNPW